VARACDDDDAMPCAYAVVVDRAARGEGESSSKHLHFGGQEDSTDHHRVVRPSSSGLLEKRGGTGYHVRRPSRSGFTHSRPECSHDRFKGALLVVLNKISHTQTK